MPATEMNLVETLPDDSGERWRDVGGFPGYQISDLGRLRSNRCARGREKGSAWRFSRGRKCSQAGHLGATLRRDGEGHFRYVHRLVLEAFVGPCPDSMECCHADDDPTNNRLTNLCWATHQKNIADCAARRRMARGRTNGLMKLSDEDVRAIRRRVATGEPRKLVAKDYGVVVSHVSNIFNRKSREDVT